MLLPRSLPPQFLLPSWAARKTLRRLQRRAYSKIWTAVETKERLKKELRVANESKLGHDESGAQDEVSHDDERSAIASRMKKETLQKGLKTRKGLARKLNHEKDENIPKRNTPVPTPMVWFSSTVKQPETQPIVKETDSNTLPTPRDSLQQSETQSSAIEAKLIISSPLQNTEHKHEISWSATKPASRPSPRSHMQRSKQWPSSKESETIAQFSPIPTQQQDPPNIIDSSTVGRQNLWMQKPLIGIENRNDLQGHRRHRDTRNANITKDSSYVESGMNAVAQKTSNGEHPKSRFEPELSIFEELFPEEQQKKNASKISRPPWFPLTDISAAAIDTRFPAAQEGKISASLSRPNIYRNPINTKAPAEQPQPGMLILSFASKHLAESDFHRIGDQGSHIEGWVSGITKIIPGRNPQTLAPNGSYILLFRDKYSASHYLDKLTRHHHFCRKYTARSLSSSLLNPTPYSTPKQPNLTEILQAYTLVPTSQFNISILKPREPLRPSLKRLIADGGYKSIVEAEETGAATGKAGVVLLSVTPSVEGSWSSYGIRQFLGSDGSFRNLQWKLAATRNPITRLTARSNELPDVEGNSETGKNESDVETEWKKGKVPGSGSEKWIVSFKDVVEARRFVRAWHRREWPVKEKRGGGDRVEGVVGAGKAMVSAVLLW